MREPGRAGPPVRRRVLVTRPAGRGGDLAARLRERGGDVDLRPTIAFGPPDDADAPRRAVETVARYRWIVVTSPTGADALARALAAAGETPPASTSLAAVGPGTARTLAAHGLDVALVAAQADADGLAATLVPAIARGDRVLVVRPQTGARRVLLDALAGAGARVDAVAFYRTRPDEACAAIARDVAAGAYDVVVFTSPSTLAALLDGAGSSREAVVRAIASSAVVAIGAVTERALRRAGIVPRAVADRPTDDGIAEAVVAVW